MVMGALISAAINDPSVPYFLQAGSGIGLAALVGIAILSNWSTCDACLYNATMGYTNAIPGLNWRNAAIVGTIIGVVAAGTGIIGNIVNWLILLGLIVPPIGGAIMADYYVVRGERGFGVRRNVRFNWAAIIAVIAGILVGYYFNQTYPNFLFGAAGIATSFILYAILVKAAAAPLGADLTNQPSGAEAGT
jgi:cytosine permease